MARIPKVDRVLEAATLAPLRLRRELVRRVVNDVLDELRARIREDAAAEVPDADQVAAQARARLDDWLEPRPRPVVNATGVVLHTNLGRAPLARGAIEAMAAAAGACDLEVDLQSGRRSSRFDHLRPLLAALVGAEDAHVVNNNAAALLLSCTALAGEGGVALSRGQMVEIGDGFRVATMAAAGGCPVWAVGSTNRTHLRDYEAALDGTLPQMHGRPAQVLLWAHLSNFTQEGFVHEVELRQLAELAKRRGVPLVADLGSGSLGTGLPDREPTITEYLQQGVDLVLCSGDKLLGGPQAGILAGSAELVQRCRRYPMARALRPDKTAIAALHATLSLHASEAAPSIPLVDMVGRSVESLRDRAQAITTALGWSERAVREVSATIGGGSLPGDVMPSIAVVVPTEHPDRTARALRLGDPAVVGRIQDDELILDLRTVDPDADDALVAVLRRL